MDLGGYKIFYWHLGQKVISFNKLMAFPWRKFHEEALNSTGQGRVLSRGDHQGQGDLSDQ